MQHVEEFALHVDLFLSVRQCRRRFKSLGGSRFVSPRQQELARCQGRRRGLRLRVRRGLPATQGFRREVLFPVDFGGLHPTRRTRGGIPRQAGQRIEGVARLPGFALGKKKFCQGQRRLGGSMARDLRPQAFLGGGVEMALQEERQRRRRHAVVGGIAGDPSLDAAHGISRSAELQIEVRASEDQVQAVGLGLEQFIVQSRRLRPVAVVGQTTGEPERIVALVRREGNDLFEPRALAREVALRLGQRLQSQVAAEIARRGFDRRAPASLQLPRPSRSLVEPDEARFQFAVQPVVARRQVKAAFERIPRRVKLPTRFAQPRQVSQGKRATGRVGVRFEKLELSQGAIRQAVFFVVFGQLPAQAEIRGIARDGLLPRCRRLERLPG